MYPPRAFRVLEPNKVAPYFVGKVPVIRETNKVPPQLSTPTRGSRFSDLIKYRGGTLFGREVYIFIDSEFESSTTHFLQPLRALELSTSPSRRFFWAVYWVRNPSSRSASGKCEWWWRGNRHHHHQIYIHKTELYIDALSLGNSESVKLPKWLFRVMSNQRDNEQTVAMYWCAARPLFWDRVGTCFRPSAPDLNPSPRKDSNASRWGKGWANCWGSQSDIISFRSSNRKPSWEPAALFQPPTPPSPPPPQIPVGRR